MASETDKLTIEGAAELIESSGAYAWLTIETMVETEGTFFCKLRGPSHCPRGYTIYPGARDVICTTKTAAILEALKHIASMGGMTFLDSEDKEEVVKKPGRGRKPKLTDAPLLNTPDTTTFTSSTEPVKEIPENEAPKLPPEGNPIRIAVSQESLNLEAPVAAPSPVVDNSTLPLLF